MCGSPLDSSPSALTETSTPSSLPTAAASPEHSPNAISSHPSLDRSRFVPGAVFDKRYRIIGLLGRGGMGLTKTKAGNFPNRMQATVTPAQVTNWMDRLKPSLNLRASGADPHGIVVHPT